MIFQRNNRKRTRKDEINSILKVMTELKSPMVVWNASTMGIDLDISMHEVLSSAMNMTIQYDPMHLDRAFQRK